MAWLGFLSFIAPFAPLVCRCEYRMGLVAVLVVVQVVKHLLHRQVVVTAVIIEQAVYQQHHNLLPMGLGARVESPLLSPLLLLPLLMVSPLHSRTPTAFRVKGGLTRGLD